MPEDGSFCHNTIDGCERETEECTEEERGWLACMLIIPPMGFSLARGLSHVSLHDASILVSFSIGRLGHFLFFKGSQFGHVCWVSLQ